MDLSEPTQVITPALEGPILAVLVDADPYDTLTAPEIVRRMKSGRASEPGVAKALRRLAVQGIVESRKSGRSWRWRINRQHLAYPYITSLVRLRSELLARIGETIDEWPTQPDKAVLFGSVARGAGDASSDIDLLLVWHDDNDRQSSNSQIAALIGNVLEWSGNHLHILEYTEKEFAGLVKRKEPIVDSIDREGLERHGGTWR